MTHLQLLKLNVTGFKQSCATKKLLYTNLPKANPALIKNGCKLICPFNLSLNI